MNKQFLITINALDFYYGIDVLHAGDMVTLVKEPDNKYDKDAIKVTKEHLGQIGYVANSYHTTMGDSVSASRIYDRFEETTNAKVLYVLEERNVVLALVGADDE